MNRKIKVLLMLLLVSSTVVGCNGSNNSSSSKPQSNSSVVKPSETNNTPPRIKGIFDRMPKKSSTGTYNVMLSISATDAEDGDLTDKITYEIYDYDNKMNVDSIPLSIDNKYKVTYSVTDSGNLTTTDSLFVVVGKGTSTCKANNFEYDKDSLEYKLVWSDEFDYEGLPKSEYWTPEIGTGQWGWGNNELQYYTGREENAKVEDGNLTITLRKEEYEGSSYTSARLITRNKVKYKYGKFEIRAKMPEGKGTWPAFWALANKGVYGKKGWPDTGEIDFLETVGYDRNKIHGTIHTSSFNGGDGTQKGGNKRLSDIYNTYHTYTTEWLPDKIIWYVDGTPYYTYNPNQYAACPDYKAWPFDQEFFIIINLAWGGNWGGAQGIDDSVFDENGIGPKYVIDYVRVYQSDVISAL